MALSIKDSQAVEMEIMNDQKSSDLEIAIAVNVPEKEVAAIRAREFPEKPKTLPKEIKPTAKEKASEARAVKAAAQAVENEKTVAERKKDLQEAKPIEPVKEGVRFYLRLPNGTVQELKRVNASQEVCLLTAK